MFRLSRLPERLSISAAARTRPILEDVSRAPPGRCVGFLTQPSLCDVLWSARYPCRVSVSDRPPVLSLPGALSITLDRAANRQVGDRLHPHRSFLVQLRRGWFHPLLTLAVPRSFPGPPRCSRSRDTATYLRSARYPCQVTVSDSPPSLTPLGAPVLSLPGAAEAAWLLSVVRLQPHRTTLVRLRRGTIRSCLIPRGPVLRPRPTSGFSQPRHCGVLWSARYPCQITVSDSPPGLTPPRRAGSLARRGGRAHAQQVSTPSSSSFTRFSPVPENDRRRYFLSRFRKGLGPTSVLTAAEILRRHCG